MKTKNNNTPKLRELAKEMEIAVLECPEYYFLYFEISDAIKKNDVISFRVGYKTSDNFRMQYANYSMNDFTCYRNGEFSRPATAVLRQYSKSTTNAL